MGAVRCHHCGATSTLEATYSQELSGLGRTRRYCPPCARERTERSSKSRLYWLGALAAASLALLALGRWTPFGTILGWIVLNVCLFYACLYATIVPHELGHAVVGRVLGFRVFSITLGAGPRLFDREVLGVRVRVHALPLGGATLVAPIERRFVRAKKLLVDAAGPAANAAGLAVVWSFDPDLRLQVLAAGPAIGAMAFLSHLVVLVLNLLPMHVPTPAGRLPNDGLQMLRLPRLEPAAIDELLAARYTLEAAALDDRGLVREALTCLEKGVAAHPNASSLHLALGLRLSLIGDYEEAQRRFVQAAELPGVHPVNQAIAWNNIAWTDVVLGDKGRLDEADRLSAQALAVLGWSSALKGTRGAVLVDRGQTEEGLRLLREALGDTRGDALHPMARATYAGALALGLIAQGRVEEAAEHLHLARAHYAICPLLPRVEAALAAAAR
jgi:tetratricopeptide (TPR) repeat protein